MSRQVDVDELDRDGALYLRDRPWLVTEAKQQGVSDIEERIADALSEESDEEGGAEEGDLETLSLTKLREIAKEKELDISSRKKADYVEAIRAADRSPAE